MPVIILLEGTTTMATFLTMLTTSFTSILTCVGQLAELVISTPFLSFTVIFLFAGGVVGLFSRLLSR